jgi:hypothetical protein
MRGLDAWFIDASAQSTSLPPDGTISGWLQCHRVVHV